MSLRRDTNQQLREAILQRFINEVERKFFEITNDSLLRKRKQQDMKLFIQLIDPDIDNILKTTSFEKLIRRISRSTSYLFTQNDASMLNALLTHVFLTRPSILDNPIFMSRTDSSSRPTSSSIRGPRREQSNEEITPGVWVRGTSFPTYTTQLPTQQTPLPTQQTPLPTQTVQSQNAYVPWGYENTSIREDVQQQNILFEEDKTPTSKIKTNKDSLIFSSDSGDLVKCDNANNDTDANIKLLSDNNKKWVETNCYDCVNHATQYNYTEEEFDDLVSIKQLDSNGKFKRGHCISIKYFKKAIKEDLINSREEFNRMDYSTIFSIYKLKNKSLPEGDLRRGIGTRPTKMLVFLINQIGSLFIDLRSAYKLIQNNSKELYALPLFGGLRRRVGNLKGSLMESSTIHGQINGYKIYRLLTKNEIENEMYVDFEMEILTEMQYMLNAAYKEDEINRNIIAHVTNNIIKILTGEIKTI